MLGERQRIEIMIQLALRNKIEFKIRHSLKKKGNAMRVDLDLTENVHQCPDEIVSPDYSPFERLTPRTRPLRHSLGHVLSQLQSLRYGV